MSQNVLPKGYRIKVGKIEIGYYDDPFPRTNEARLAAFIQSTCGEIIGAAHVYGRCPLPPSEASMAYILTLEDGPFRNYFVGAHTEQCNTCGHQWHEACPANFAYYEITKPSRQLLQARGVSNLHKKNTMPGASLQPVLL